MNLMLKQKTIKALRWIINILNQHQIDYQISGGFAGKIFGSERELNDIDIDISEKNFSLIISDISEYIIYGPEQYRDDKWDLKLITLNYKGQEIDISGADTLLISSKDRTRWIPLLTDFSKTIEIIINDIIIKVINPKDFIKYKSELDGNHQLEDIQAAKQYIKNKRGII